MFAVIKTGGKQYLVSLKDKIKIEKIKDAQGKKEVSFSDVLLLEKKDGELIIGSPFIENASVKGKILSEGKGKKVIVFKYKAKKRYKKKNGHRQPFMEVEIESIQDSSGI